MAILNDWFLLELSSDTQKLFTDYSLTDDWQVFSHDNARCGCQSVQ